MRQVTATLTATHDIAAVRKMQANTLEAYLADMTISLEGSIQSVPLYAAFCL